MRRCTIQIELDCSPDRFWALYFREDFTSDTFVHGLGWRPPQVKEERETETEIIRNVSAQPQLDLPKKIAKILGERFGYDEFGRFEREPQVWNLRHRTNTLGDKLGIIGTVTTAPISGGRTRLRAEFEVECSLFGVGGVLERIAEQNIRDAWPKCGRYWNKWLAAHPELCADE